MLLEHSAYANFTKIHIMWTDVIWFKELIFENINPTCSKLWNYTVWMVYENEHGLWVNSASSNCHFKHLLCTWFCFGPAQVWQLAHELRSGAGISVSHGGSGRRNRARESKKDTSSHIQEVECWRYFWHHGPFPWKNCAYGRLVYLWKSAEFGNLAALF